MNVAHRSPAVSALPLTVRMRRSPFWAHVEAATPRGYLVYNHMLVATGFSTPEDDYHHLKSAVQIWDVGAQRQVEIAGRDAARLVQLATPRDISALMDDQCMYIPTVDAQGRMTNDPVLLRRAPDRYWLSISDSDLILFFQGAVAALGLDVRVHEPEVYPLALQGPLAEDLAVDLWGDAVRKLRFFRHMEVEVLGRPMRLARSGYSVQGGFELYFEGQDGAAQFWDQVMEAGRPYDIRVGAPSQSERIEAGLLSYRSDITGDMTPFEAGLSKLCHLDHDIGCAGFAALQACTAPQRQIRPLEIAGPPLPPQTMFWPVEAAGQTVGRISSSARAYDFGCNAAIGLIDASHWHCGTPLDVITPEGKRPAVVKSGFWGRFS